MAKKTEEKQNVVYAALRLEQFTPTKLVNGAEVPELGTDGKPRVVNCYLIYGTYLGKKTKFHMTTKDSSLKSDLADFFEFSKDNFKKDPATGELIKELNVEIRRKSNIDSSTGEVRTFVETVCCLDSIHEIALQVSDDEKKRYGWFVEELLENWKPNKSIQSVRESRRKSMEAKRNNKD